MHDDYTVTEVYQKPWDGKTDRRAVDAAAFQLMAETRQKTVDLEKSMTEKIDDIKDELDAHMVKSELRHKELTDKLDALSSSTLHAITGINQIATQTHEMFKRSIPNGDPEGHRNAHEKWIKKADEEERFWYDIKNKAVSAIIIAVVGWAGIALWTAFLKGPV